MSDIDLNIPSGPMGSRFLNSAAATAVSQAIKVAIQFLSVIILARLLTPADFGVVAMAGPVIAFITLFSDIGLNSAAIQRPHLSHEQANSLFWVTMAISLVIALVLLASSPLVHLFYNDIRPAYVCAATSIMVVVGSLSSQHYALLARRMQFGRLAVVEIACSPVPLLTAALAAIAGAGYWSLVISSFAGALASTMGGWLAIRWRPSKPALDPAIGAMLRFGAGVTGFNFANFWSRNLDNLLIGHRWGASQLGLYDRAYKLLLLPISQVTGPISRVAIPTLSRFHDQPHKYRDVFVNVMSQMLLLTTPGVVTLIATAHSFIPTVMGERWADVAPIFVALGFAGLLQSLNNPTGWLFITQSRTNEYAGWGAFGAIANVAAFFAGLPYGAVGVAIAYSVSEYLRTPLLWWLVTRRGPVGPRDALGIVAPHLLSTAMVLPLLTLVIVPRMENVWICLIASTIVSYGIAVVVALAFPTSRSSIMRAFDLLGRSLNEMRFRHAARQYE